MSNENRSYNPERSNIKAPPPQSNSSLNQCYKCGGLHVAGDPHSCVKKSFQERVKPWIDECFGPEIAADRSERNHRFMEESIELVQACGGSARDCHELVDYVFSRPVGEPLQEVGGVMVTLAALCLANGLNMQQDGEIELLRIWGKMDVIRKKQAAKPKHGARPE